ncbi:hypothetical protein [Campylobacter lanienae]|uniref:LPD3 domain-containing protein n=1 Tax=Campylobacter lanienae TaxID=75658 RepID=UPI000BB43AD8|nr:hypothetical protein [Campylobacter lanienae]
MAEIYTVRSILGDESLQNLINQGKSQDEIISIAKAYKDEAIKSGDKDALNRMNLVSQKQGRADFFTRLGDKMDANGYETMGSIARGIDILASKAAAPIAGLVGDSDKEAQILADMKLTQSINEAKNLDKIATTARTQREYQIDSNNLLANAIGSYTKDSKTYARNLIEQAENSGYTAMDRFNIGMATTANTIKYLIKSSFYGEDSKEANDIKDAQKILQASRDAYEANNPDKWNVANFAGEMITDPLNAVGLAKGFKVANTAFKKGANVAFDLAQLGAIGGMAGAISEYGSYKDKDEQNVAGAAMIGAGAGVALGAGFMALGVALNKIASRFGQKSTLEQNAQTAKDETAKELEKGTPQDIDKRLQKISDDIEEAFSTDENGENIARLLGQEYDDNINKAIKESEEVSTAIDSSVAKFANDNPNSSASDIEIYINKTYAPSESEKELTRIINDDKPVTPRMAGYRVLGVLQKSMEYKTRFERDTIVKRFKNHGFNDELANVFADAYIADDISVARRYLDSKVASNRQKSVEDGRNEWLESTTKSNKAKAPKNQDEILKEISSDKTPFKLIDDSDMTPELKSRLENDGYTLEREPESGVWEVSKAISDQEIKETLAKPKELYGKFRNNVKNILNKLIGIDITNKNDGRIAQVSKTNISKMISDKAIQKSLNNGFSAKEHFEAVESVEELYKNAIYKSSSDDIKNGDKALKIHRYEADFKDNAKVLITLKESIDKNQNRIYTLEVEAVESKLSTKAPENKHSALNSDVKDFDSSVGSEASFITTADSANDKTIPNQDLKSADVVNVSDEIGVNSTKGKFKSNPLSTPYSDAGLAVKAQDTRDGVRPNASIAKTDEKTIPNESIKEAENNPLFKDSTASAKQIETAESSLSPKPSANLDSLSRANTKNSTPNEIKSQGERILYQSPNANSISQTLLQTSQYSANKIDVAPVSTPKNDLDRTLSNRYDSSNSTPKEIKSQEPQEPTQPQPNTNSRLEKIKKFIQGKTNKALDSDIKTYNELYRYVLDDFAKAHPDELNLPKYASEMANYITKEFLVKHDKEIKEIINKKTSGENRQIALNAFENLKENFDELRSMGIGDLIKPTAKGIKDKIAEIEIKSMSDKELVTQFQKLKDSKARVNENLYKYLENEIKKREKKLYPFINSKDYSYDLEKQLKNRGLMGLKDSDLENIAKERNSVLYLPSYIRDNIEQELNIKPIKEFGTNYAEFYHDGANAIKKLLTEREGQVAGAFHKDGRDITLVWGVEGTGHSDGYGLAKIAKYHPEVIDRLDEIVSKGEFYKDEKGRLNIRYNDDIVGLRDNWLGNKTEPWIISSYTKKVETSKGINSASSITPSKENYSFTTQHNSIIPNQTKNQAETTANKSQELNLSRAERRSMGIEEPKGKTLVIDEKAVKSDVREFGRLADQVGLGFKSAKEAKAVMDKCDKSKFDCGS